MMRYTASLLLTLCACQSAPPEPPPPVTLASELPAVTALVIKQREWMLIPGSDGQLRLNIDDITAGATLVRLSMMDRDDLVPRQSMSVGDTASFTLDKRELVLGMSHMVNRLIGDDYAQFHVGDAGAVCQAQIKAILRRIETSSATFLLKGSDCDGKTMALHLRQKVAAAGDQVSSGKDFIEQIATQKAPGGAPYGVRALKDTPTPLARWIRGRR